MTKFSNALIAGATALSLSIAGTGVAFAGSSFGSSDRGASVEAIPSDPTAAKIEAAAKQSFINNGLRATNEMLPYVDEGVAAVRANNLVYYYDQVEMPSKNREAYIAIFRILKSEVNPDEITSFGNVDLFGGVSAPFGVKVISDSNYYYMVVAVGINPNQIHY